MSGRDQGFDGVLPSRCETTPGFDTNSSAETQLSSLSLSTEGNPSDYPEGDSTDSGETTASTPHTNTKSDNLQVMDGLTEAVGQHRANTEEPASRHTNGEKRIYFEGNDLLVIYRIIRIWTVKKLMREQTLHHLVIDDDDHLKRNPNSP